MKLLAEQTVEELVLESFAQHPMRAIQLESSDDVLVGGILIIRGEREFDYVRSLLTKREGK